MSYLLHRVWGFQTLFKPEEFLLAMPFKGIPGPTSRFHHFVGALSFAVSDGHRQAFYRRIYSAAAGIFLTWDFSDICCFIRFLGPIKKNTAQSEQHWRG